MAEVTAIVPDWEDWRPVGVWRGQFLHCMGCIALFFPLSIQVFYGVLAFSVLYLVCRPRLAACLGLALVDAVMSHVWMSGAELLAELDAWIIAKFTGRNRWRLWPSSLRSRRPRSPDVTAEVVHMLQSSDVASALADENLSMNNSDAVVQAASLGAHLAASIHQRALVGAPRSDVVDGLAADAVAQTDTAGFGACAAVGLFVLMAKAGRHLGF